MSKHDHDSRSGGASFELESIVDWIGEILAFLTIALILALYINGGVYEFIPAEYVGDLALIREIAIVAVVALKGLEFALKRRFKIVLLIFLLLVAAVVVFMFFPGSIPAWVPSI